MSNDAGMTARAAESKSRGETPGSKCASSQRRGGGRGERWKTEERDGGSEEEEVCDFGVGVGA